MKSAPNILEVLNPSLSASAKKRRIANYTSYLVDNLERLDGDDFVTNLNVVSNDKDEPYGHQLFENIIQTAATQQKDPLEVLKKLADSGYKPSIKTFYQFFGNRPDYELWKNICAIYQMKVTSIIGADDDDRLGILFHTLMIKDIGIEKWLKACEEAPFFPSIYHDMKNDYTKLVRAKY